MWPACPRRTAWQRAMPSSSGISQSVIRIWQGLRPSRSRAWRPLLAQVTWWAASASASCSISRAMGSSSAINTCIIDPPVFKLLELQSLGLGLLGAQLPYALDGRRDEVGALAGLAGDALQACGGRVGI